MRASLARCALPIGVLPLILTARDISRGVICSCRFFSLVLGVVAAVPVCSAVDVQGNRKQWTPVTLTFDGPNTAEDAEPNPFRDYRLTVTFRHAASKRTITVPGFYCADGDAGQTSAASGNKWRAIFVPDQPGTWSWTASFRSGKDVATTAGERAGDRAAFDGDTGSLRISAATPDDPGMLQYTGEHYLRWAGSGRYYLKGGADSPENFLAYQDFDGTYDADSDSGSYKKVGVFIHTYLPHVRDWQPGDPTWKDGKGKGIIGALNYLAEKGVNSVYFLTYNIDGGDGRDTWMWTTPKVRDRYDVSKLDQWEKIFSHMDAKGIMLHVVTQETENDHALGGSAGLNAIRRLYYRELCARFAHHRALVWNLGEENNTPDPDRKEIAAFIRALDPYRHPVTVHTHNNKELEFYNGILGDANFEATSIQGDMRNYNRDAIELRRRSAEARRRWAIFGDEQPPDKMGVMPDEVDPNHDVPRQQALWGNLMGGGSGVEWYFGYAYPNMDINCEDFRSRDRMWDQTRYALDFFQRHLPFSTMEPDNDVVSGAEGALALKDRDRIFALYLPSGGQAEVSLGPGTYAVRWYSPRKGGQLQTGTVSRINGPGRKSIGQPPADPAQDWAALISK